MRAIAAHGAKELFIAAPYQVPQHERHPRRQQARHTHAALPPLQEADLPHVCSQLATQETARLKGPEQRAVCKEGGELWRVVHRDGGSPFGGVADDNVARRVARCQYRPSTNGGIFSRAVHLFNQKVAPSPADRDLRATERPRHRLRLADLGERGVVKDLVFCSFLNSRIRTLGSAHHSLANQAL